MSIIDIQSAVYKILTDNSFAERVYALSQVSKTSQGLLCSMKICQELMNAKENQTKKQQKRGEMKEEENLDILDVVNKIQI